MKKFEKHNLTPPSHKKPTHQYQGKFQINFLLRSSHHPACSKDRVCPFIWCSGHLIFGQKTYGAIDLKKQRGSPHVMYGRKQVLLKRVTPEKQKVLSPYTWTHMEITAAAILKRCNSNSCLSFLIRRVFFLVWKFALFLIIFTPCNLTKVIF